TVDPHAVTDDNPGLPGDADDRPPDESRLAFELDAFEPALQLPQNRGPLAQIPEQRAQKCRRGMLAHARRSIPRSSKSSTPIITVRPGVGRFGPLALFRSARYRK